MKSRYGDKCVCPVPARCPLGPKRERYACPLAGTLKNQETDEVLGRCVFVDLVYSLNRQVRAVEIADAGAGIVLPSPGGFPGRKPD